MHHPGLPKSQNPVYHYQIGVGNHNNVELNGGSCVNNARQRFGCFINAYVVLLVEFIRKMELAEQRIGATNNLVVIGCGVSLGVILILKILFRLVQNEICPNWIKLFQNGSDLSKMNHTFPKWVKLVQNGSNLS